MCGETRGAGGVKEREAWWWNPQVQNAIKEKRLAEPGRKIGEKKIRGYISRRREMQRER